MLGDFSVVPDLGWRSNRSPAAAARGLQSAGARVLAESRHREQNRSPMRTGTDRGTGKSPRPRLARAQLLVTCVAPSSHAVPLNPFLPPAAFLVALPSFTRRPARPASTLWRSTTGLLRAIRIARRRLVEGALAGAGGEGRGQLPKYVVVISGTDIENVGGDDVWFEDEDQNEPWESFAKSFSRVSLDPSPPPPHFCPRVGGRSPTS